MNVRPETIKFLEENKNSNFTDTSLSNILRVLTPKAKEAKNKQMGIQSKKAFAFRKPSSKQKGNLLNGERYLQITYPKRG